jgi:hypothetical protein
MRKVMSLLIGVAALHPLNAEVIEKTKKSG